VSADAKYFADVIAEFADVCSSFTAYFEEDVAAVSFNVINIVDASCAELTFN
jgi:hypothetical protein